MIATDKVWPWKLLLAVILIVTAAGIYGSVSRIDYEWRWYRVPQYFLYKAEDVIKTPFDGVVKNVSVSGSEAVVDLVSLGGEQQQLIVDGETVKVDAGEDLFEGDTIGFVYEWNMGPLLTGLWTTMWISAVSSVFGLLIGLIAGLMKISKNYTVRTLAAIYVEVIRGTPLLVQIFIAYFFFGTVFNLDRNVAGIGALALFAGAYVAEIIRAGIQSIAKGQMEAARSLGMSMPQAMIDVILPQAFKRILPPLSGQFISLIKDSSLVSVIAITDLTKSGREIITSTFATFEIWLVVAAMYLIVTSILSQFVFYLERRYRVSD
ncbi:amino acid ABC transporter permease [Thermodesulfobacteriota bacterium]